MQCVCSVGEVWMKRTCSAIKHVFSMDAIGAQCGNSVDFQPRGRQCVWSGSGVLHACNSYAARKATLAHCVYAAWSHHIFCRFIPISALCIEYSHAILPNFMDHSAGGAAIRTIPPGLCCTVGKTELTVEGGGCTCDKRAR